MATDHWFRGEAAAALIEHDKRGIEVDLYRHLAEPSNVEIAPLPQGHGVSVTSDRGVETITKVVETGDEGRGGLLLGQIVP